MANLPLTPLSKVDWSLFGSRGEPKAGAVTPTAVKTVQGKISSLAVTESTGIP